MGNVFVIPTGIHRFFFFRWSFCGPDMMRVILPKFSPSYGSGRHKSDFHRDNYVEFLCTDRSVNIFSFGHFQYRFLYRFCDLISNVISRAPPTQSDQVSTGGCVMYARVHFSMRQLRVTSCTRWVACISTCGRRVSLLAPSKSLTF